MLDSTLALMKNPYGFISETAKKMGVDIFETRLLLQPVICMTGQEASEKFNDESFFMRRGAAPGLLKSTLVGHGGVQGLDGEEHHHRKALFMSLMSPKSVERLSELMLERLDTFAELWSKRTDEIILYDEIKEILTRAVCAWAGVELSEDEVKKRTHELSSLFEDAGSKGPRHLLSRINRKRSESWMMGIIRRVREEDSTDLDSPLKIICAHRDLSGQLLDERTAAVEVLNLLRPVVAVSVYLIFVVHALQTKRDSREMILQKGDHYVQHFVQEVRRFYPFFPALMARVKKDFEWKGFKFKEGKRVMLDLYGINHDERIWMDPDLFEPMRFHHNKKDAFSFVPQGTGSHELNHRCPGEFITIALMESALKFFTLNIQYEVPEQDLQIDMQALPALPKSKLRIKNVSRRDIPQNDSFSGFSLTF